MNTHKFAYKVVLLAMVFGLLAAPVAFAAEDKDDNPLYNIPLPSEDEHQYLAESGYGEELEATAALSEEEKPVIIRDFSMDFVGPQWERVPGKSE